MRRFFLLPLVLLALLVPAGTAVAQAAATLELVAEDGTRKAVSAAELAALPQLEIRTTDRDSTPLVLKGPSLRSILDLAGAPGGHELRGPRVMLAVVAEAADGYRVVYSLAELDPQFGAKTAILVLTRNGGPLTEAEAPFRVAIAGEQHHSRWIRQVTRLRVVMVAP